MSCLICKEAIIISLKQIIISLGRMRQNKLRPSSRSKQKRIQNKAIRWFFFVFLHAGYCCFWHVIIKYVYIFLQKEKEKKAEEKASSKGASNEATAVYSIILSLQILADFIFCFPCTMASFLFLTCGYSTHYALWTIVRINLIHLFYISAQIYLNIHRECWRLEP